MKKIGTVLLIIGLFASSVFAAGQNDEGTIKVGAILAVTGGASFLGAPEAKTIEMVVEDINAAGGVNGKMIELIIKDSAANPEKAISFAKQLIEEDNVIAIVGPSTSGETMQIKDLCQSYKVPLVSCAAAEAIVDPVASYVFKTPQKDNYVAEWIYTTMNSMGIKKIGVIAANTGFGNAGKGQLEKYAPDFGIEIVIAETYDKASTDLTALLTKVKAQNVEAVVNWSIVPAQSIVPKNMKQLGMEVPLFQSHGFGNIKYVEAAGEAAEGIIFPAGRLLIAEKLADNDPQKKNLVAYKSAYETKYNEAVSTFGGHAYDAIMLVIEAAGNAKTLDRAGIRDALEAISGFPGTGGIFNFTPSDHNGLGMDSLEMLIVKNGQFDRLK
ncbi:ABC transporter substrate-binding protein [Oceanispirochaeta sp.]|jgi:branched-chain amino acid transport system substrate-binding protein|uniref:ABC transporter substrate-binding protein n=1 Tax=Oceanispirochaeta sp. TaxID=2035350 RepID=UPI00260A40A4|nr:ABC transporter substrate-binding protein [Oceanispirochaeta sp.]MDA3955704.1 ABC transporter substrate-binding protein [Oceanispirochaeta sp.]